MFKWKNVFLKNDFRNKLKRSDKIYYCTILAMGNFDCCMSELKKYEGLTIKYPLCVHDYMVSKDYLWMLKDPSRENSCRSEPIHYHLDAEKVMAEFNLNEKRAIEKSAQQKRGPTNRQLLLCSNKRKFCNASLFLLLKRLNLLKNSTNLIIKY